VPAASGRAAVERSAKSRTLDTVVTPGFGELRAASFGGGVVFAEADMQATAPDAEYNVANGTLRLQARETGAGAQVVDASGTIEARRIDLTLDGRGIVADGDVRSRLKASSGASQPAGRQATRRPGMLNDDQPVHVTAGHLLYDSGSGQATYSGDARLWQGETALQADTIVLDDTKGSLGGNGNVRSTLRLEDTDVKTGAREIKTTMLTAGTMAYDDDRRLATYSVTARMNGPEGDLRGDRIELYLAAEGHALDRIEAYTGVSLRTGNRTITGARMTYFATDARYVMSGTPVRALEQMPLECRETQGRTLTFFRSVDTISVDGHQESRTQTTSGGKCPEPPKTE